MTDPWPLLIVAVLASLASVVVPCVFWVMHAALSRRVARLEAQRETHMTHADATRIYERMASVESKVETLTTAVLTIQKYLREKEP